MVRDGEIVLLDAADGADDAVTAEFVAGALEDLDTMVLDVGENLLYLR